MVDYQTISVVFTGLSVSLAAFYYISTLRNAQRSQQENLETRQAQLFMQLYQRTITEEANRSWTEHMAMNWEDFDDYREKYGPSLNPDQTHTTIIWSFYDGLGILVQDKMVDIDTVYRMMGNRIIMVWLKSETLVKRLRKEEIGPGPDYVENFTYLANEMIRIRKQKGLPIPVHPIHPTSTLRQEVS